MNNTGASVLSILIPSIPARIHQRVALEMELRRQHQHLIDQGMLGEIEVLVDDRPGFLKGGPSIGSKRGDLVKQAQGLYLCFLDDDESIAPNYVDTLLRLCNTGADVCTFRAMVKLETAWGLVDMRLAYKVNDQFTPEHTLRRPPWHTCPVKTEFAKLYEFQDKSNAEDFSWFEQVLTHCATEAHTDKIIFQYNHGPHSEADKIEAHVQPEQ